MNDVPSSPLARPDINGADARDAERYVRDLQQDGRLLLRFVARRPDRLLGTTQMQAQAPYFILTKDPRAIAANPVEMTTLAECVDDLSRRAAPATVSSIRLSAAYLRVKLDPSDRPSEGEPPPHVVRRARWLRWVMRSITVAGIITTVLSVLLLAHVDDGRRAVQQLEQTRAEVARAHSELAKLALAAWVDGPEAPLPDRAPPAPAPGTPPPGPVVSSRPFLPFCIDAGRIPSANESGALARSLCSQLNEAELREKLVFLRLTAWNCRTHWIYLLATLKWRAVFVNEDDGSCGTMPGNVPDADVEMPRHWQRTEIRTAGSISVLTGFILPLLLGCVGGCAYALRRLDQRLSDWVLEVQDGSHSFMRVLLATMLGGLLGVLWTGNEQVQLSGFTLSVAALAFFVGFSLEVVFTVIEAMVDGVAGKLRAPLAPSVAAPPAPAARV